MPWPVSGSWRRTDRRSFIGGSDARTIMGDDALNSESRKGARVIELESTGTTEAVLCKGLFWQNEPKIS
jgi:hypothetical protein